MLQGSERAARQAKVLRKTMSLPEVLLWQQLKLRPSGLKFRSQHPAGAYIVDFYCHKARAIIEIDGIVHDMGDHPEHDLTRDASFRRAGLNVIRVPAVDVLRDPVGTAEAIGLLLVTAVTGEPLRSR